MTALENDAVAAFDALRDDPELTGDGLVRLRELAGFVRQVRAREGEILAAAAQVAAEFGDLAGQFTATTKTKVSATTGMTGPPHRPGMSRRPCVLLLAAA
ncbi:hypothetical protein [Actinoplanes sp. NPDC051859]|uniref:hypothetical protein n=1 Tax=Actinoplanes sp. NPDC051859 TaxID=3363909 RepID=UPI0037990AC7